MTNTTKTMKAPKTATELKQLAQKIRAYCAAHPYMTVSARNAALVNAMILEDQAAALEGVR